MQDNALMLKPINDLLNEKFYIPAYQRGYRWTKRQVTDLLNDLKEFQQESEGGDKKQFYCLQPIVVKKQGDQWEVVDGQQRLTTIYIILTSLKFHLDEYGYSRYEIDYETRPNSSDFLESINANQAEENIDFFHIVEAKKAVDSWLESQDRMYRGILFHTLLNSNKIGKNVKVIWYELGEHENATAVFTRLNMGKIPLVNAELVKALFLKSNHFVESGDEVIKLQQLKISQEWDSIEKSLQNDAFWYFLSNLKTKTNRIEFILNLRAAELHNDQDIINNDQFKTFLQFNKMLAQDDTDVSQEWLEIKKTFMTLSEWFNDRVLFHLVGYLISQNVLVSEIFEISSNSKGKKDFHSRLIKRIWHLVFDSKAKTSLSLDELKKHLADLIYENGKTKHLSQILLLFNIVSLLNNRDSNARFQFEKFKLDNWDIEHIRSVSSVIPEGKEQQKKWLREIIEYLSDDNTVDEQDQLSSNDLSESQLIKNKAMTLCSTSFNDEQFKDIYECVINLYDSNSEDEVDNSIGNLTLLDSSTNRSYKNAIFPIKRKRIIKLDKEATYVPLCTRNVFLKYYSINVDKMLYWEASDSNDYQTAILNTITKFFTETRAQ